MPGQSIPIMKPAAGKVRPFYRPLDSVLVRTPLLPASAYDKNGPVTSRHSWVDCAVAVGSLSLAGAPPGDAVVRARQRYLTRMATRPTPYGLFAGVALASWSDATTLSLSDEPPVTHTRPDMDWLLRLVANLEARHDVRALLNYRASTAALIQGGRIVLAEQVSAEGDGRVPPRISIRATSAVRLVMEMAREARSFASLVEGLAGSSKSVPADRIEGLLHQLIDQTLLLGDLRPPLTCASPVDWLLDRLERIPPARNEYDRLAKFVRAMRAWDNTPVEGRVAGYHELAKEARGLGAREKASPLQVDTTLLLRGDRLHRDVGTEVARAASLMMQIGPVPRGFPYLRSYLQSFVERYGERREVPLLELLDEHRGLGPPDPNAQSGWIHFPERDQTLLDLACRALRDRQLSIDLQEVDLANLETWRREPGPLPMSLDVCAFVYARPDGVDDGEFTVVIGPNVGSMAAGRNLGRFGHNLGSEAEVALRAAAKADHVAGTLQTELVYLPRSFRLANVALRPKIGEHEIVVGVSPGVASGNVIPVDELVVGVDEGRFYLRWPGHAERVVVTSGHMLNYLEAPALCRFLAHMHMDGETQLHLFDWGPAAGFPFLPRVQAGRVVLRLAQWRLAKSTGAFALTEARTFAASVAEYRASWQVPRHVYLGSGDVRLLLDLENADHLEELRRELRRLASGAHLILQEALPGPGDAWVPGPGGHYVVELVVSLALQEPERRPMKPVRRVEIGQEVPRMVPPGSDWLYMKLYGSPEREDDLLTGPFSVLLQEMEAAGAAPEWFFLRYSDPDSHLRIRLRTPTPGDADLMLPDLCDFGRHLLDHDVIQKFSFDTYEREIERYGGSEVMTEIENLFVADSLYVQEMLRGRKIAKLSNEAIAAVSALDLLNGLGIGTDQLQELATRLRSIEREAGPLYRELKKPLLQLMDGHGDLAGMLGSQKLPLLAQRRRVSADATGRRLRELMARQCLTAGLPDIAHSLVHVHCNRLLGRDRNDERKALGLMLRLLDAQRRHQTSADDRNCR